MEKNKLLILGVGNELRRDDGVGLAVIKLLQCENLDNVDIVAGGIDGLNLIDVIKQYSQAIIIDAVDMRLAPATIELFAASDAKIKIQNDALSTHGIGLAEVIALLEQLGCNTKIHIIGVQPQDISFGEGLTDAVAAKVPQVVEMVKELGVRS